MLEKNPNWSELYKANFRSHQLLYLLDFKAGWYLSFLTPFSVHKYVLYNDTFNKSGIILYMCHLYFWKNDTYMIRVYLIKNKLLFQSFSLLFSMFFPLFLILTNGYCFCASLWLCNF